MNTANFCLVILFIKLYFSYKLLSIIIIRSILNYVTKYGFKEVDSFMFKGKLEGVLNW